MKKEMIIERTPNGAGTYRIAMLIDGDNAQPSLIQKMLAETSKYGLVIIRRIYGDWTTANMSGWKDTLQTHAIQPIQQFRYTTGKNATDSAMIIDAMDTLYTGGVDGFCIVSSDSDYTRLATRIREKGFFVMGIGKKNHAARLRQRLRCVCLHRKPGGDTPTRPSAGDAACPQAEKAAAGRGE